MAVELKDMKILINKNMDLLNVRVLKFHCHIYMNSNWINDKLSPGVEPRASFLNPLCIVVRTNCVRASFRFR